MGRSWESNLPDGLHRVPTRVSLRRLPPRRRLPVAMRRFARELRKAAAAQAALVATLKKKEDPK